MRPRFPRSEAANPYLAARYEFTSVYTDLARSRRNWQVCAWVALALLSVQSLAYINLSSQARITPYVVEVDRAGHAQAFGPAEILRKTDTRLFVAQLSLFVRNIRTVYADERAQRDLIYSAYAFVAGSARNYLDEYFSRPGNDPRNLARTLTREVQVLSVLRVPNASSSAAGSLWKIRWQETSRPRFLGPSQTTSWEAYLSVHQSPPTDVEGVIKNPLGLFVTEINWTQLAPGDKT